jgi:hypothetical protein
LSFIRFVGTDYSIGKRSGMDMIAEQVKHSHAILSLSLLQLLLSGFGRFLSYTRYCDGALALLHGFRKWKSEV